MMQAINEKKRVEQEHILLQARIVKLRKEKDKATAHIKDMERKQKLMLDMHQEKKQRIATINTLKEE